MRVARTEVNMAYQASDSERWTNSWWVKGIRICLSNNHTTLDSKGQPTPLVDICDDLSGDYPPDFKFTGWHPQCRCYATAITCDYADIREYYRRKRAGEDMTGYTPPGAIKEPPAQFKRWLADNSDRLDRAAERDTTPYFINNNRKYTDPNWTPVQKLGNYGAAMKMGVADQKRGRKAYEHAAVTKVSEAQMENLIEIADLLGIRRKKIKPMNFNQADSGMGNVDYGKGREFDNNCPATIYAHEMRLRGLNVTALGFNENEPEMIHLMKRFQDGWIEPKTSRPPKPEVSGNTYYSKNKKWQLNDADIIAGAESLMLAPGRYHIGINQLSGRGHVIIAERLPDGELVCYDAQRNMFVGLADWGGLQYLEVVRVDNLTLNTAVISKIVRKI